jgi:toluene monooxygenase system ferredoxin subunit
VSYVAVLAADALWSGEKCGIEVGDQALLLVRIGEQVYAYDDRCPHKRARLSQGSLTGTLLRCAAHAWEYDVTTGLGVNPRNVALRRLPVRVEGGSICVDVHAAEGCEHA